MQIISTRFNLSYIALIPQIISTYLLVAYYFSFSFLYFRNSIMCYDRKGKC